MRMGHGRDAVLREHGQGYHGRVADGVRVGVQRGPLRGGRHHHRPLRAARLRSSHTNQPVFFFLFCFLFYSILFHFIF
jgi:hypothetical protein